MSREPLPKKPQFHKPLPTAPSNAWSGFQTLPEEGHNSTTPLCPRRPSSRAQPLCQQQPGETSALPGFNPHPMRNKIKSPPVAPNPQPIPCPAGPVLWWLEVICPCPVLCFNVPRHQVSAPLTFTDVLPKTAPPPLPIPNQLPLLFLALTASRGHCTQHPFSSLLCVSHQESMGAEDSILVTALSPALRTGSSSQHVLRKYLMKE